MGRFEFRGINKIYLGNVQAVFDFDLEIEDGEFVAFVGPSGCGKSTMLRMVAGLEGVTSGELLLDGKVINNLAPVDRDISMVFQDYALYPNLSVYDNVGMSYRVRRRDEVEIYEVVTETAKALDIAQYLTRMPGQLSGGQKQRVALSRAVSRRPKAFLMDEPLSNLDAKLRAAMRVEIKRLQKELGVTTIYVTHDQIEAMTMADRIVVMKEGRVQQIGTPMEIYDHPANLFVGSFIGSPQMNYIRGTVADGCFTAGGVRFDVKGASPATWPKEVIMGVRPEHISLSSTPEGSQFAAEVTQAEFLGSVYHVFFDFDGEPMTAKVESKDFIRAEKLYVRFDMDKAHFFDAAAGTRL